MKTSNIFATLILATTFAACSEGTKVEYSTAPVEKQNISTSITATGTIEPVTEVEVGTQVSGIIDRIYVDYNSEVHRGQVIAELDKTNLLSKLASAQSNLSNAQS
ncbi:MAG: biotin/lipoyl-binding protein, partial [Bacteroidaceae bacterium]|nr:biotin/lipoyl-binding protein [Bacteroidaceae bacterium]